VKTVQELEAALQAIVPGTPVKIVYKVQGKEIVLEGSATKSQ
jgi:hypothetical protein